MSKAFVNEAAEKLEVTFPHRHLTDTSTNYMTKSGLEKFRAELSALEKANNEIDIARRAFLYEIIDSAQEIVPEDQSGDRVVFGATVTVRDEDGKDRVYKIVGLEEIDPKAGKVSWASPIGKALLGAQVGDAVAFRTPSGEDELEILKIEFLPIP